MTGNVEKTPPKSSAVTVPPATTVAEPAQVAKVKEVPVQDILSRYGWDKDTWQSKLLIEAAGGETGTLTAAKLDKVLENPTSVLTSSQLRSFGDKLEKAPKRAGIPIDKFDPGAERRLARRTDSENTPNKSVTAFEWKNTQDRLRWNKSPGIPWAPDMGLAPLRYAVASMTGEPDMMKSTGKLKPIVHDYDVVVMDPKLAVPLAVTYTLTADDLANAPKAWDRTALKNFVADPLFPQRKKDLRVDGSGFDRGHQRPAGDSPNYDALLSSFIRTNAALQTAQLNQEIMAGVERAIREMVRGTNGKAIITSGSLMVDRRGKEDKDPLVVGKMDDVVAVPQYFYKAILLERPDGSVQAFALKLPNSRRFLTKRNGVDLYEKYHEAKNKLVAAFRLRATDPEKADKAIVAAQVELLNVFKGALDEARVSISDIEKDLKMDLFKDVSGELRETVEQSRAILTDIDEQQFPLANLVFGPFAESGSGGDPDAGENEPDLEAPQPAKSRKV